VIASAGSVAAETAKEICEHAFRHRGDLEIDVREIMVRGRGVGYGDDPKAGAFRGERAGVRILERDRLLRSEVELREDALIKIGRGFGRGDIVAAGEKFETLAQPPAQELAFDVRTAGV
jgi:hypothetical protein